MTFGSTFGRVFSPTFQPKSQAAVVPAAGGWWDLNGTIASCIAAYQPKGAASLAASYDNLTGNATYDATEGTAPAWDGTNGWKFTASSSQYLVTGITPASGYSMIVRYSDGNTTTARQSLAGYHKTNARFRLDWKDGSVRTWASGGYKSQYYVVETDGVMCVAGQTGYFNGVSKVTDIDAWTAAADDVIWIGATNGLGRYTTCYIQAVAIYNATLTGTQVGNLTTAMAAL